MARTDGLTGALRRLAYGGRAGRLSNVFAELLGGQPPELRPGALIGLEHEYVVRQRGRSVDFRRLVHRIAPSARGLHPGDPNAYWLPSGALLTADGAEAELALPPTEARPGFTARLVSGAHTARSWLFDRLPRGATLEGVSTHLSVAIPNPVVDTVALEYAYRFAIPLMLLLDRKESPGLLVRPRSGRLELCGEFSAGDDLRAAVVFALGSALALARGPASDRVSLPPRLALSIRPADQRAGWYVDRRAAGDDLYTMGRTARLRTLAGGARTAQDQLEEAWSVARLAVQASVDADELGLVDRLVDGRRRLPIERSLDDLPNGTVRIRTPAPPEPSPFGRAARSRRRPGFALAPIMVTWDVAMFVVASEGLTRRAYVVVPGGLLGRFVDALDGGHLDEVIAGYLALAPAGRRLGGRRRALGPGLYGAIGLRVEHLPVERSLSAAGRAA